MTACTCCSGPTAATLSESFSHQLHMRSHVSPCWCCFGSCSEILKHEDLDGKINTACLGSLLQQDQLDELEDQYLVHKQVLLPSWIRRIHLKADLSSCRNIFSISFFITKHFRTK